MKRRSTPVLISLFFFGLSRDTNRFSTLIRLATIISQSSICPMVTVMEDFWSSTSDLARRSRIFAVCECMCCEGEGSETFREREKTRERKHQNGEKREKRTGENGCSSVVV